MIISKIFFGFDVRTKGSGNMGSTNVFRVLGTKWGIVVQAIDIFKAWFPIVFFAHNYDMFVGQELAQDTLVLYQLAIGFTAMFGHIFSVFVKFKGGKGVNTAMGLILAVAPAETGVALIFFFSALLSTGYISLASIAGSCSMSLIVLARMKLLDYNAPGYDYILYFFILLAVVVLVTHKANIKRLIGGTENRFDKLKIINFSKKNERK